MTNAATAATTAATKPSKMELARRLFDEVTADGYVKAETSKSLRNDFIRRAIAEIPMTQSGAATYWQNLQNKAKGEPLYKYGKARAKADGQALAATTGDAAADLQTSSAAPAGEIGKFRWMAVNAAGEELASYPTRALAQKEAAALNCQWVDRKTVA